MEERKDRSGMFSVILLVGIALLIGGMLILYWLFHTPIDWGVVV